MKMMYVQFCLVIFISAAFATGWADIEEVDIVQLGVAHRLPYATKKIREIGEGARAKRSITIDERDAILSTFNNQRGLVGSSDMNYLSWSLAYETVARNWTKICRMDEPVYGFSSDLYVVKRLSTQSPDHAAVIRQIFQSQEFYYPVRSIYLTQVSGESNLCETAIVNGEIRQNVYLSVYILPYSSCFNANVRQFTIGKQCTACEKGSQWCFNKLCRADCSSRATGCLCNAECYNSIAVDQNSCTCMCSSGYTGPKCDNRDNGNAATSKCISYAISPISPGSSYSSTSSSTSRSSSSTTTTTTPKPSTSSTTTTTSKPSTSSTTTTTSKPSSSTTSTTTSRLSSSSTSRSSSRPSSSTATSSTSSRTTSNAQRRTTAPNNENNRQPTESTQKLLARTTPAGVKTSFLDSDAKSSTIKVLQRQTKSS